MGQWRPLQPDDYPGIGDAPAMVLSLVGDDQTRALGKWLATLSQRGDFVGLIGSLGAGKTTLMQGFVDALDDTGTWEATSPTYALLQVYETEPPVFHIDLYRLEGWAELESIGYWDYVEGARGISCVEWLNRIPGAWPGHGIIVELQRVEARRKARLWCDQRWTDRVDTEVPPSLGSTSNKE